MTPHSPAVYTAVTVVFSFVLSACGGATFAADDAGAGGGSTASGGQAGTTGGNAGASNGGASVCCLAAAICDAGDQQISDNAACPVGRECYSRKICCSQIQCVRQLHPLDAGVGGGMPIGVGGSCAAAPLCDAGDSQISGNCPAASTCYQRLICNSTITCRHSIGNATGGAPPMGSGGQCTALPTCPSGDTKISGSCPTGSVCYPQSLCGTTITCGFPIVDAGTPDDAATCNPAIEYNRKYAAQSVRACETVDYACPAGTASFGNACGCGCEQDASCPQYVDCMPGPGALNSLCSTSSCPYTVRAM